MAEKESGLRAVDQLDIIILMDNSIDVFLPDSEEVRRTRLPSALPWGERKALMAEHGYSALVRVHASDRSATILFDAGVIPRTVKELKTIGPRLIMPVHCTGWKATHELAREFSEAFVQPSVGTRLVIKSNSREDKRDGALFSR